MNEFILNRGRSEIKYKTGTSKKSDWAQQYSTITDRLGRCMDELGVLHPFQKYFRNIGRSTSLSKVFQKYREEGRVNMKGSVQ